MQSSPFSMRNSYSSSRSCYNRSASFVITLFATIINSAVAIQVLSSWRSLKWERESEWDSAGDTWRFDSVKIIWGLLSIYFAVAATVSSVGFIGVVKSKPSMVRFYRDYSIADFAFSIIFLVVGTYVKFKMSTRTGVCEELSRQPELMRDLAEMGLNIENCERWFERAVMAAIAVSVIIIVARLHFLLAVSNYYSHLCRSSQRSSQGTSSHTRSHSRSQRIYLLPTSSSQDDIETALVYAPVPLHELSPQLAQDLRNNAKEAWVKKSDSGSSSHRYRSHQHSDGESGGHIHLPSLPDEPLLPAYYDNTPKF